MFVQFVPKGVVGEFVGKSMGFVGDDGADIEADGEPDKPGRRCRRVERDAAPCQPLGEFGGGLAVERGAARVVCFGIVNANADNGRTFGNGGA